MLYDSVYEGLVWRRNEQNYVKVVSRFQQMWTDMMTKLAINTHVYCMNYKHMYVYMYV